MSFTQTMEVQTNDEAALPDHVGGWHTEQAGIVSGYRRARVLADSNQAGQYLIEWTSAHLWRRPATTNAPRPTPGPPGSASSAPGAPEYRDFRLVCTTEGA